MSVRAMAGVWKHSAAATAGELLVLLALADWADEYGYCYPSWNAIAEKARVSERQVARVINKFVRLGELEKQSGGHVVSAPGHRAGRTGLQPRNLYRLTCVPDEQRGDMVTSLYSTRRSDAVAGLRTSEGMTSAPQRGDTSDGKGMTGTVSHIRSTRQVDPSVDPSEGQAGASPRSRPADEDHDDTPDDNLGSITKFAHFAIEQLGPDHEDLTETVKALCARYAVAYDSGVVRKAIDSAIWQRGHRARSG